MLDPAPQEAVQLPNRLARSKVCNDPDNLWFAALTDDAHVVDG